MRRSDETAREPQLLPIERELRVALRIYGWRALALVLTMAPVAALYVLALVIVEVGHHPAPLVPITLAALTFVLVGVACFATGALINIHVTRMPPEVRFVLAPLAAIATALAIFVGVPLAVISYLLH